LQKIWEQSAISKDQIIAAESSYEASSTAYEGTVIEQKVGERTVLDVLNAQQTLLNSEIELINQRKNKEIIKWKIRAIGSWLVTGGILVLIIL
jgi:outer membrane protein TolC